MAKLEIIPTERPTLDRALKRLAHPERLIYGTPITAEAGPDGLLRAVLREIDETILPREIVIESQEFGTMRLSVSNRRLAAIALDHDLDAPSKLAAEDSKAVAAQFAQILTQSFAKSTEARILRPRRLAPGTRFNMSCSCRNLAEAAGLADFHVVPDSQEEDFADVLHSVALALVQSDGETTPVAQTGEPGDIEFLQDFYRNYQDGQRARGRARRFNHDEPECIVVPLANARTVVLGLREAGHVLALVPNEDTSRLVLAWHAEHRRPTIV